MDESKIKTKFRIAKEARELAIYNDWNELTSKPGVMKMSVYGHLCEKYNISERSTIWVIIKRVEKQLKEEGKL